MASVPWSPSTSSDAVGAVNCQRLVTVPVVASYQPTPPVVITMTFARVGWALTVIVSSPMLPRHVRLTSLPPSTSRRSMPVNGTLSP